MIVDNVYWVGVNDYLKDLFEGLWPLPYGISYNSYVVVGDRDVALIDTVDEHYIYEYIGRVQEVVRDLSRVRYIVVNHLEPDHHGATEELIKMLPNARLVMSSIAMNIANSLYNIPRERIVTVKDGDVIDLGGKKLRFIYTPWLHWPETMMTYLEEDGILFSCDAFGSYGALENGVFDDEVDLDFYLDEAKRYFSNIVIKYSKNVIDAIEKLEKLGIDIRIIAPSHGPIYRSNPRRIIDLYRLWTDSSRHRDVLLIYGSMYGRTKSIVDTIENSLREKGINIVSIDASRVHESFVLQYVVTSKVLVIIYPSYDASVFPYIYNLLYLFYIKNIGRGRYIAIINTYSWAPTHRETEDIIKKAGFTVIEPIISMRSLPSESDKKTISELIEKIAKLAKD
ncbi:beta-lactamase domain protein [Ignisphaera aggregans DSM 17230]|uniref:Beta-lactamase domain protein n=1 Tax=Ignisphaera aggregans (strain DSM 17230 / JCM 13409 / AQ1.S1) TaxID=583356 RepID=E0STW1_IGNAA|nr:beta-lactamase domain protein [Ignisphaera aggregans DSM 17230]